MIKNLEQPKLNTSGVYQFLNGENNIIYIGSSKNLTSRINSYKYNKNFKDQKKYNLLNEYTKKIIYIYTEDYKKIEKELIQEHQPTFNKKSKKQEFYLKKDFKYLDLYPLMKSLNHADIGLILSRKGIGKTTVVIRDCLIEYGRSGTPSVYLRSTFEQLKEFAAEDKLLALLNVIGYPLKDISITSKGMFKSIYDKDLKKRVKKPVIYFLSINGAMQLQSSKFLKCYMVMVDEIQNHFLKSNITAFNKFKNVLSSVLREENSKIIIFSNKVNAEDIFLENFKIERQVPKMALGQIKRFQRSFWNEETKSYDKIIFSVYNPKRSIALQTAQNNSISQKVANIGTGSYKNVITSDSFSIQLRDIQYIKKYGDFEAIINYKNEKIGVWINVKNGNFQFSRKFNKNGTEYFLNIGEFSEKAHLINQDYLLLVKNKLLLHEVEFSNTEMARVIIEWLEQINLYKN